MPRHRKRGGAAHGRGRLNIWDGSVGRLARSEGASRIGLGVLRERPMRRFFAAQLASNSGDFMVIAALPFAVFAIGGSGVQVGIAFGAGAFLELVVVLFGGVVGDRFQRRAVMIAADVVRFASQAILAVLLILGVAEFWEIVVVQIIQGVGAAFFNPALDGLVPEVVSERRLQDANALLTTSVAAGTMLGPAIAGMLISSWGVGWAFALDAGTFAMSAALLASIHLSPAPAREPKGSMVDDLFTGWKEFRLRTWLWVVVAEFALLNALVFGPFQMLGASVAVASFGGLGAWTVILAANGAGRLGGGLVAAFWRPQRPLFTGTLVIATWSVPLVLLAIAAPLSSIVLTVALAGAALSVFGAIWRTTLQSRVPEDQISRMSSYDWLGSLALLPFGYLIATGAQSLVGAEATLVAGACVVLASTAVVVSLSAIRGIRATEFALAAAASDRAA